MENFPTPSLDADIPSLICVMGARNGSNACFGDPYDCVSVCGASKRHNLNLCW
jgi:hypothetical protein